MGKEMETQKKISSFILGATESFNFQETLNIVMPSILAKTENITEEQFLQGIKDLYHLWHKQNKE